LAIYLTFILLNAEPAACRTLRPHNRDHSQWRLKMTALSHADGDFDRRGWIKKRYPS
jgi:hypothetical protein